MASVVRGQGTPGVPGLQGAQVGGPVAAAPLRRYFILDLNYFKCIQAFFFFDILKKKTQAEKLLEQLKLNFVGMDKSKQNPQSSPLVFLYFWRHLKLKSHD